MLITRLQLQNWRNFTEVDVPLQKRQFIVGPNASGKSNLLDAFRFLRDIAKQQGGGLQYAVAKRGGMSRVRCLSARKPPGFVIAVSLSESESDARPKWQYEIGVKQMHGGRKTPCISFERVRNAEGEPILDRPNDDDRDDEARLKQTYLEQVNNNRDFREIAEHFEQISYLHLVPQLLRHADEMQGKVLEDDPFGQGFLESMAKTSLKEQKFRLRKINEIIKAVVPPLEEIKFERDPATGRPHITALHSHWRPNAGRQAEDQFSDGTLRLMGLVWSLLEKDSMLLLEEPELSLNVEIVRTLAALLFRAHRKKSRQVLVSTHSTDLLTDEVGGEEVLVLEPTDEGTAVKVASDIASVVSMLKGGFSVGEAVMSLAHMQKPRSLSLFDIAS